MAAIPLVDTHFHLHDLKRPELRYVWLERDAVHGFLGDIDPLKSQHYWIEDYISEIRFANVPKAIHVQAALGTPDPVDVGLPACASLFIWRARTRATCWNATCNSPTCGASATSATATT